MHQLIYKQSLLHSERLKMYFVASMKLGNVLTVVFLSNSLCLLIFQVLSMSSSNDSASSNSCPADIYFLFDCGPLYYMCSLVSQKSQ